MWFILISLFLLWGLVIVLFVVLVQQPDQHLLIHYVDADLKIKIMKVEKMIAWHFHQAISLQIKQNRQLMLSIKLGEKIKHLANFVEWMGNA